MSDSSQQTTWFYYTREAFRACSAIIKASDVTPPVARLKWGMSVHCGRKQRGRRPTAKCLCIIHAACKLASCSLLKRNCSEFEIHLLLPHSRAAACWLQVSNGIVPRKPLFHFVFPSSIILQWPCFNASVFLMCHIYCIRLNYTVCSIPAVHSCISNACAVFFFFLFSLCESMDVPESVMQFWIIGT